MILYMAFDCAATGLVDTPMPAAAAAPTVKTDRRVMRDFRSLIWQSPPDCADRGNSKSRGRPLIVRMINGAAWMAFQEACVAQARAEATDWVGGRVIYADARQGRSDFVVEAKAGLVPVHHGQITLVGQGDVGLPKLRAAEANVRHQQVGHGVVTNAIAVSGYLHDSAGGQPRHANIAGRGDRETVEPRFARVTRDKPTTINGGPGRPAHFARSDNIEGPQTPRQRLGDIRGVAVRREAQHR